MRTRSPLRAPLFLSLPLPGVLALAAFAGCSDATSLDAGQVATPLVDTIKPAAAPDQASGMPALGVSGIIPDAPLNATGPDAIHEGQYTSYLDLQSTLYTPSLAPNGAAAAAAAWTSGVAGDPSLASAAFAPDLVAALGAADGPLGELDSSDSVEAAVAVLKDALALAGGASFDPGGVQKAFAGYKPLRARWLASHYAQAPSAGGEGAISPVGLGETNFKYADPRHFGEIRDRGARLYCAARAAQSHMTDRAMGEQVGFSVDVFGHPIDFFVVTPTVAMGAGGPQRMVGVKGDGAQAFEVPLDMGVRITPVRGVGLPGLGEIDYPVVLVSGDSEVQARAELRPIKTGQRFHCGPSGCSTVPTYKTDYARTYRTVSHADGVALAQRTGASLSGSFTLFYVGPVKVSLDPSLGLTVGQSQLGDDRLLKSVWPVVPTATRAIRAGSDAYRDSPFCFTRVANVTGTPGCIATGFYGTSGSMTAHVMNDGFTQPLWNDTFAAPWSDPMLTRALTNDDHSLATASTLTLDALIAGTFGGTFGPITLKIVASGGMGGSMTERHYLRDAVVAEGDLTGGASMVPVSVLSVRPETSTEAHLDGLKVTAAFDFDLEIDLWVGTMSIHVHDDATLYDQGQIPLAGYTKTWGDDATLRIGTGSPLGYGASPDPMRRPLVRSHAAHALSGGESIAPWDSFAGADVDACLADPAQNPPPAPKCAPEAPSGGPAKANVCVWAPSRIDIAGLTDTPPDICENLAAYAQSWPGAQGQCLEDTFAYLCSGTHAWRVAPNGSKHMVSKIIDVTSASEMASLKDVVQGCVQAHVSPSADPSAAATYANQWFNENFHFAVCDDQAHLIDASKGFAPIGDPAVAPPVTPASCP